MQAEREDAKQVDVDVKDRKEIPDRIIQEVHRVFTAAALQNNLEEVTQLQRLQALQTILDKFPNFPLPALGVNPLRRTQCIQILIAGVNLGQERLFRTIFVAQGKDLLKHPVEQNYKEALCLIVSEMFFHPDLIDNFYKIILEFFAEKHKADLESNLNAVVRRLCLRIERYSEAILVTQIAALMDYLFDLGADPLLNTYFNKNEETTLLVWATKRGYDPIIHVLLKWTAKGVENRDENQLPLLAIARPSIRKEFIKRSPLMLNSPLPYQYFLTLDFDKHSLSKDILKVPVSSQQWYWDEDSRDTPEVPFITVFLDYLIVDVLDYRPWIPRNNFNNWPAQLKRKYSKEIEIIRLEILIQEFIAILKREITVLIRNKSQLSVDFLEIISEAGFTHFDILKLKGNFGINGKSSLTPDEFLRLTKLIMLAKKITKTRHKPTDEQKSLSSSAGSSVGSAHSPSIRSSFPASAPTFDSKDASPASVVVSLYWDPNVLKQYLQEFFDVFTETKAAHELRCDFHILQTDLHEFLPAPAIASHGSANTKKATMQVDEKKSSLQTLEINNLLQDLSDQLAASKPNENKLAGVVVLLEKNGLRKENLLSYLPRSNEYPLLCLRRLQYALLKDNPEGVRLAELILSLNALSTMEQAWGNISFIVKNFFAYILAQVQPTTSAAFVKALSSYLNTEQIKPLLNEALILVIQIYRINGVGSISRRERNLYDIFAFSQHMSKQQCMKSQAEKILHLIKLGADIKLIVEESSEDNGLRIASKYDAEYNHFLPNYIIKMGLWPILHEICHHDSFTLDPQVFTRLSFGFPPTQTLYLLIQKFPGLLQMHGEAKGVSASSLRLPKQLSLIYYALLNTWDEFDDAILERRVSRNYTKPPKEIHTLCNIRLLLDFQEPNVDEMKQLIISVNSLVPSWFPEEYSDEKNAELSSTSKKFNEYIPSSPRINVDARHQRLIQEYKDKSINKPHYTREIIIVLNLYVLVKRLILCLQQGISFYSTKDMKARNKSFSLGLSNTKMAGLQSLIGKIKKPRFSELSTMPDMHMVEASSESKLIFSPSTSSAIPASSIQVQSSFGAAAFLPPLSPGFPLLDSKTKKLSADDVKQYRVVQFREEDLARLPRSDGENIPKLIIHTPELFAKFLAEAQSLLPKASAAKSSVPVSALWCDPLEVTSNQITTEFTNIQADFAKFFPDKSLGLESSFKNSLLRIMGLNPS